VDFPDIREGPELLQDREQEEQVVVVEVQVHLHLVEPEVQGLRMAVVVAVEEGVVV
jgi:hypothetical protein